MTASQKLRQLYEGAQAYYDGDVSQEAVIAVNTYVDTLAENGALIASVVEAAEAYANALNWAIGRDFRDGPECIWIGPGALENPPNAVGAARAALTALEEELS